MIGFIKKDLAMIKSNFKTLGLLFILYAIMGFYGEMDISFILPFISVMIMISTFSYDSYNKWDAYLISFPNGRKNSVKAKYLATLLMILAVSIVTLILSFVIAYTSTETINFEQIIYTMLGTLVGTILVLSIMYPIIYKFGVEKARIAIFALVFGIVFIGGFILQYIDFSFLSPVFTFLGNYIVLSIIIISVLMVYASYRISLKIQMKKEF